MKNYLKYVLVSMSLFTTLTTFAQAENKTENTENKGLYFSGQGDFISIETDTPESDYTFSIWFKTNEETIGLFSIRETDLGISHDRNLWISKGQLSHRLFHEESIHSIHYNVSDNQWHQATIVLEKNKGQKLFIDGQLVTQGKHDQSDFNWDKVMNVGYAGWGENLFFKGFIKDVKVINKPLSNKEVLESYLNKETDYLNENLLGFWPLNNNYLDYSDYQNHGQLRYFKGNKLNDLTAVFDQHHRNPEKNNISIEILNIIKEARTKAHEEENRLSLLNTKTAVTAQKDEMPLHLLETLSANIFSEKKTDDSLNNEEFLYKEINHNGESYVLLKKTVFQNILTKLLGEY